MAKTHSKRTPHNPVIMAEDSLLVLEYADPNREAHAYEAGQFLKLVQTMSAEKRAAYLKRAMEVTPEDSEAFSLLHEASIEKFSASIATLPDVTQAELRSHSATRAKKPQAKKPFVAQPQ